MTPAGLGRAVRHCAIVATVAVIASIPAGVGAQAQPDAQVRTPARVTMQGGLTASSVGVRRDGFVANEIAGPVLGAVGRIAFGRFGAEGAYSQGNLLPPSGLAGGIEETFADVSVFVGMDVGAGFTIGAGPRLRGFISDAGTVRWSRLEARARYVRELVPGRARADVDLWQVLSADVNAQGGSNGGRGGSVGVSYQLPNSLFALRAAYTADRMAYKNGTSEFVDRVEFGLRYGRY